MIILLETNIYVSKHFVFIQRNMLNCLILVVVNNVLKLAHLLYFVVLIVLASNL